MMPAADWMNEYRSIDWPDKNGGSVNNEAARTNAFEKGDGIQCAAGFADATVEADFPAGLAEASALFGFQKSGSALIHASSA